MKILYYILLAFYLYNFVSFIIYKHKHKKISYIRIISQNMQSCNNRHIHNKEYQTSSIAVIRNTHLMSCICTFVAFLIIKV